MPRAAAEGRLETLFLPSGSAVLGKQPPGGLPPSPKGEGGGRAGTGLERDRVEGSAVI